MTAALQPIARHVRYQNILRRTALLAAMLMSGGNLLIPRLPLAILILLIVFLSFGFRSSKMVQRSKKVYAWLLIVTIASFLPINPVDVSANFTRLINFVVALSILKIYRDKLLDYFVSDFVSILTPLAILAAPTTFLAMIIPGAFVFVSDTWQNMYTLGFILNYAVPVMDSNGLPRPIAIFWEPGIFAVYLNITLFFIFAMKYRVTTAPVIIFAIFLTQSTTGIMIALLQSLYFIFLMLLSKNFGKREFFIVILGLFLTPIMLIFASQNIDDKFFGSSSGSYTARSYDYEVAAEIIKKNPFLGIGFSENNYLSQTSSNYVDVSNLSEDDVSGRFNTSGLLIVIYSLGIPLAAIYFMGFLMRKSTPHRFMFATVLLTSLVSNPIAFTPIFAFFAFYGLTSRNTLMRQTKDDDTMGRATHRKARSLLGQNS